ncbi:SRPBCC family protein [Amycolatopsis albispora]|uniref:Polyketide cyclase /reductase n=1 Tax=Amycolatopsis albispora TaxID=1804986 RepID=A0A344KZH1_9PSEU|nr:SRPBCC family protein [Amycolatopsis albispora]AXB41195.1 polyketide cyclase /reductase [Amycolatopsis albispora]
MPSTTRPRRHRQTGARAALIALPLACAGALGFSAPAQATETRAGTGAFASQRSQEAALTCRGQGVDPAAKIRYRAERLINAPLSKIFRLQTDVESWPSWQEPVLSADRLDHGPLRSGSRFRWTTPAPATPTTPETTLVITSTVHQVQPGRCLRWSGPAIGDGLRIDNGVHVWNFRQVRGGVLVSTEETWTGAQVEADVPTATHFLGSGLELWLDDLKATAEGHPC